MNRRRFVVSGVTGGLLGGMVRAADPNVEKDPSPLLRAVYDMDWDLRLEAGGEVEGVLRMLFADHVEQHDAEAAQDRDPDKVGGDGVCERGREG